MNTKSIRGPSERIRYGSAALLLLASLLSNALAQNPARAEIPAGSFDGVWQTILSCQNAHGALGYSFKFPSTVKDGRLHGEKGTRGEPGWLQIDGPIGADGKANLYADGLVGASDFAVGQRPAGTSYGYHIEAVFAADTAEGHRVEGRPCSVVWTRER